MPLILVKLKNSLVKHDAFSKEGLFRVSGQQSAALELRRQIDRNEFEDSADSHTVAALIKVKHIQYIHEHLYTLNTSTNRRKSDLAS